jgi:hypothetical protein
MLAYRQCEGILPNAAQPARSGSDRVAAVLLMSLPVAAGLTIAAWSSGTAEAQGVGNSNCPHGNNVSATACLYGTNDGADFGGIYTQFTNQSEKAASVPQHVNNSIWLYSGTPCSGGSNSWVEAGLIKGYFTGNPYAQYYAAYFPNGSKSVFKGANQSPDGTSHSYELEWSGGNGYLVYIDGALKLSETGLGNGAGCMAQTGLETSALGTGYSAASTDHSPLKWADTSYNVHSDWNTSKYWNDIPCGSPPGCMDGSFPGGDPNQWTDDLK